MNDPHVVALNYRIDHGNSIDYSNAVPMNHDEPGFWLTVDDNRARFRFKEHYATVEKAREALAEYIRVWEFHAQLENGPNSFKLEFDNSEVIDREPTPGEVNLNVQFRGGKATGSAELTVCAFDYPQPPSAIALNPDVETMYGRYMGYREGREPLASMASFCLTVLEAATGADKKKRSAATETFKIDKCVLSRIGDLSANKGGVEARKADGLATDFSSQERDFLERAVKAIIRRVAEKQFAPEEELPIISTSDLPSIESNTEDDFGR